MFGKLSLRGRDFLYSILNRSKSMKKFTNLIKNIRLFAVYIEHVITLIDNSYLTKH